MARFIQIEERDLEALLTALRHVINRHASTDQSMVAYLQETLGRVEGHLENERFGCAEANEIDHVLNYLGGGSNGRDAAKPERRKRGRRVVEEDGLQEMFKRGSRPSPGDSEDGD